MEAIVAGAVGGIVGSIITAALSLIGVMKTLDRQAALARAEDARHLRDARSDRTRQSLGKLLAVALQMQLVTSEPILTTAPIREELQTLRANLKAMWPQMFEARAEVLAEPDGLKWMTDFEEMILAPFAEFQNALQSEKFDRRAEQAAVKDGLDRFQAAVSAHFATLDKPI